MKVTSRDLKHFIKDGKIENIYLFAGPEVGEKKEIIKLLEQKLFPGEEPEKFTFYCDNEFDSTEFMNTLQAGMLFSAKKIVYLKNVEHINADAIKILDRYIFPYHVDIKKFEQSVLDKLDDKKKKKLLAFYEKDANTYRINKKITNKDKKSIMTIILSTGYENYNRDTYLIMLNESNDRIPAKLTDLLTPGQHIIFWEMFENQKVDWVRAKFKENQLYVEDEAIKFLLDMIPNNKYELENEIDKIVILFNETAADKQRVINLGVIEAYIQHSKAETPFSLYSAMLRRDLGKSLTLLKSLFQADEYGLLNGLVWSHRRFFKALDLYENQKLPVTEIFKTLRIFLKSNKDEFQEGFKYYSFNHASVMFYYISELDYYTKVLPHDLKLVKLQEFVINFICGDKRKTFLQGPLQFVSY